MRRIALFLLVGLVVTACSTGGAPRAVAPTSAPQAELPSGGNLAPAATPKPSGKPRPGAAGQPLKIRNRHVTVVLSPGSARVCSLITRAQLNNVIGGALPTPRLVPVGTFDECAVFRHKARSAGGRAIQVAWAVPPASVSVPMFRQHTINLSASDAVSGLGSKAYCSANSVPVQLFVLNGKRLLEVFADSCAHAVALARIALSRL